MRVLHDELQFPDDRGIDQDTKSLIRGVGLFAIINATRLTLFSSYFSVSRPCGYANRE